MMLTVEKFMDVQRARLRTDFLESGAGRGSTEPYVSGDGEKVFYGVFLWHPHDISKRIEDASHRIAEMVPSIVCDAADAHVGAVVYNGDESGDEVLKKLAEAVHRAKSDLRSPRIVYDRWFYNTASVIAAGTGNDAIDGAFIDIINGVLDNYEGEGLVRKRLAQITSNRFLERRTQEELEHAGFFGYMKRLTGLGESRPRRLGVIHQTVSVSGSVITPYETFDLSG